MGIKNFSKFIEIMCPQCYFDIPLASFAGSRISIDMNHFCYLMADSAKKSLLRNNNLYEGPIDVTELTSITINNILSRLDLLLRHKITPVCVFDSKPINLKTELRMKRKIDRERIDKFFIEAEEKLSSLDPLQRDQETMDNYIKYFKQHSFFDWTFMNELRNLLGSIGFPVFQAEDFDLAPLDAEGVCACLAKNNYTLACITRDSDYHVYGGDIAILEIRSRQDQYYFNIRILAQILQQSGLSFNSFQDLCILLSCDFNKNIPGIGVKKSCELIKKYNSIPAIVGYDITPLNYEAVKKIFLTPFRELTIEKEKLEFNVEKLEKNGRDILGIYNLSDFTSMLFSAINK